MIPLSELPRHVTVFVNWLCNLRCRQCWLYGDSAHENAWLNDALRGELPVALFSALVDELLSSNPTTSISLMGGEPLLHRGLPEMITRLKSRSSASYIDVSTNGTTLHKDAERLLQSGIDQIYVSLDGASAAVNDAVRGPGSFVRIMRGVARCLDARERYPSTRVSLNFTVTALNYLDMPAVARLAQQLGANELSINFAMFYAEEEGTAAAARFDSALDRRFMSWRGFLNGRMADTVDPEALRDAIEHAHAACTRTRLLVAPLRYDAATRSRYFSSQWRGAVAERTCPRLGFQTTLLPNGDITSCTPFADTVVGNLYQESLRDIWHGARYNRVRAMLDEGLTDVCYRCCDLNNDMDLAPEIFLTARSESDR